MHDKPDSVLHSIAEHYHRDAYDFAVRFDVMWEKQLHKSGRIKSFVDLFMGCECALKSHIFLGKLSDDPKRVYSSVRKAGHDIGSLAHLACYSEDRSSYEFFAYRLSKLSTYIRYSLDSYEVFFRAGIKCDDTSFNYGKTIGNNSWVLEIRNELRALLRVSDGQFTGLLSDDIETYLKIDKEIGALVTSKSKHMLARYDAQPL